VPNNPWRTRVAEWVAEGYPPEWEVDLADIPAEYELRVQACNRLRRAWRRQMTADGFDWREYNTRFVPHRDGTWSFRWWVR
jgi:hypothetical protein